MSYQLCNIYTAYAFPLNVISYSLPYRNVLRIFRNRTCTFCSISCKKNCGRTLCYHGTALSNDQSRLLPLLSFETIRAPLSIKKNKNSCRLDTCI